MNRARLAAIGRRAAAGWRIGCTLTAILIVEAVVCGLAALPPAFALAAISAMTSGHPTARTAALAAAAVPAYVAFALALMPISAVAGRVSGARIAAGEEIPVAGMGWPLMRWARGVVSLHVVRLLAGHLFRGTPIWTAYLRMCGARLGRRVYVNSLGVSDYHLLEFGDDVVIGADAHVSGHTVEYGALKTGRVTLGPSVTIGVSTVVEIDVTIGGGTQVGALSFVPKHTRLDARTVYAGIPVRRLHAA